MFLKKKKKKKEYINRICSYYVCNRVEHPSTPLSWNFMSSFGHYFKKEEFISETLEDREVISIRDLKTLIYKEKLAGWKGFLQEQSKNNGLKSC